MALWKQSPPVSHSPLTSTPANPPAPEPVRSAEPVQRARPAAPVGEHTTLGKGIVVKGEISGSEALFIDGEVQGVISVPGERVTVGPHGRVSAASGAKGACIIAREIVVLGKIVGNVEATDRVEIRANASLTGDISTVRITIEDGAFFRGGIDIRQTEAGTKAVADQGHLAGVGD